eukprot:COSAG01_NODE_15031_length_1382_cov_36.416991_1_plen_38_part_10
MSAPAPAVERYQASRYECVGGKDKRGWFNIGTVNAKGR